MPDRPPVPPPALPNPLRPLRPRAKPRQTEANEQRALFQFLRYWSYREPRFGYIFSIPNGGKRDGATAAQMYLTGTLAGVWDVCVPYIGDWEEHHPGALYLEMKSTAGRLTEAQEAFRAALQDEAAFVVCRSWIEAARAIATYLDVQDEAVWAAIAVNEKGPRPVKGLKEAKQP